jgi:CelD/BcsL family acetyltransferase involved in cellulose biosynthesis
MGGGLRAGAAGAQPAARDSLAIEIMPSLDGAEALWRSVETSSESVATPYQRFDWCRAYLEAMDETEMARVAVLRDATGRLRMLLPLVLRLEYGLVVARSVGDDHANYHLPLLAAPDAATLSPEDVRAALAAAGKIAGIDVFALAHQPLVWEGVPNPYAAGGEPEPADAYGVVLGADPEATSKRLFSGDARKKLRSKEKRLVDAMGPVEMRRAGTPEEARAFLSAFYAQKAARFASMGIDDPYAPDAVRRFLERAAEQDDPAVEVHALRLVKTGRVLAVFGGAVNGSRYSGMMTSFDADPEVSRFSPGDLLLYHLVRDQAARGRLGFDLGIGEARYKASLCDETIALAETLVPVSGRGHVFALTRIVSRRLKRRIKANPRLAAAVTRLRALRRR